MTTQNPHPHIEILRAIYSDLTCIDKYVDDDVVLHTADRGASGRPAQVTGREAVLNHELALIRMTGNTLVMQVQQIVANDSFGAVLGALQVDKQGKRLEMPFCGLWRFRSGRIIEHWENAYDISAFGQFLLGEVASNPFEGRSS